jgi:hypothetical protein
MTVDIDDMFTPAGAAVALSHGCELAVHLGDDVTPSLYLTKDDLSCRVCDGTFDTPSTNVLSFIACNKVVNDGLCRRCDPVVGPPVPDDFDR